MKRGEYLQHLSPQYFYEFLRNFSVPYIAEQWRKARNQYADEDNYCPDDDSEILKLWLNEEVDIFFPIIKGKFILGHEVTVIIHDKQITRKVQYNTEEGLYIVYDNAKYFEFEFEYRQ